MWKFRQILLLSFLIAALLIPLLRWIAFRFNVLDRPKAHGIHVHPVPRLGGVAIFIAFIMGSLYRMDLSQPLKGILVGSSIIFIIGLIDDLVHLKAGIKLAGQLVACGIMMFKFHVILHVFPDDFLNSFFTALGIIGITNAVNFLDNMDGLAAGLISISSLTIFVIGYNTGQLWLGYLSMALVGACFGFLVFNLRKAHVFMGDSGSTFLGFTLASLAVMTQWSNEMPVTLSVPLLILGVPVLDMFLITVLRIKEGKVKNLKEWIDYTGKDHFSHRVMRLGWGERGAVFSLWGLQAVFGLVALAILPQKSWAGFLGIFFYLVVVLGITLFFMKRRELVLQINQRTPKKRLSKI